MFEVLFKNVFEKEKTMSSEWEEYCYITESNGISKFITQEQFEYRLQRRKKEVPICRECTEFGKCNCVDKEN